jgi:hypothetical protein
MLIAGCIEEPRIAPVVPRVVSGEIARPGILTLEAHAAEREVPVRHIVERRDVAVLHRLRGVADEAPLVMLIVSPDAIVGLPYVWAVANGNEPLQVERHLLATDAKLHGSTIQRTDPGDERLLQVEWILVNR